MTFVYAVPAELDAVVAPLSRAADLLQALAEDRRQMTALADGSPNRAVRQAVEHFVERWELTVWRAGQDAFDLAAQLGIAATNYRYQEARTTRCFRGSWSPE